MKKVSILFSSLLTSSLLLAVPSFADSSSMVSESSQSSVSQSSVDASPTTANLQSVTPQAVNGYWNLNLTQNKKVNVTTFTIKEKSTIALLVTQKRISGSAPSINKPRIYYQLTSSSGNSLTSRDVYGDTNNERVSWTNVLPGTYTLSVFFPAGASGEMTASTTGNVYTTPSN